MDYNQTTGRTISAKYAGDLAAEIDTAPPDSLIGSALHAAALASGIAEMAADARSRLFGVHTPAQQKGGSTDPSSPDAVERIMGGALAEMRFASALLAEILKRIG